MTTKTTPAPSVEHPTLAAALAAFQQTLPRVGTDNLGVIPGKDGKQGFKYKYADLAEVTHAALPMLAAHGLSWSCKPTLQEGRLVLHYVLRHTSGEFDEGFWPLQGSTPQQLGSAITYGRRYCLTAVTGIAPDEDDDGHAAEQGARYASQEPRNGTQPRRQPPTQDQPADDAPPSPGAVQGALRFVKQRADREGIPWNDVRLQYAQQYQGEVIDDATDPNRLTAFAKLLAANGAPA